MKIIHRVTRLKHIVGMSEEINLIAEKLNLKVNVVIKSVTNWLFHVDVEISIIIEGDEANINEFDSLIK